jgi:hypothetical protein
MAETVDLPASSRSSPSARRAGNAAARGKDKLWRRPWAPFALAAILFTAGLAVYAQTVAFAWDEGFHLLAAQLIIRNGKTPYLDFFFPQAPLNAYWNAGWMRLFGDTWRTAHAVAGMIGAAGVLLAAHAVYRRFPIAGMAHDAGALAVVALAGSEPPVRRLLDHRAGLRAVPVPVWSRRIAARYGRRSEAAGSRPRRPVFAWRRRRARRCWARPRYRSCSCGC